MSIVAAKAEGAKKKATKTKRGKVASKPLLSFELDI